MSQLRAIVGTQWGDEGKGRMIDYFAQEADIVIRYQGGNNAGHTIVNHLGTFKLHLIPSGIFNESTLNLLGPGMVIDIQALVEEINDLKSKNINVSNIRISDRATICLPYNKLEDGLEEERLGKNAYGSTKKGIAPAYGDRVVKKSIQIGELLDHEALKKRIYDLVAWKNLEIENIYHHEKIDPEETFQWTLKYGKEIEQYICDTKEILDDAKKQNKSILFEAQLGALRDVVYGIYPFTSSSNVLADYAKIGSGLFGNEPIESIGVMKAFSTCVGAGPFVTEVPEEIADPFRRATNEYGASTGRPRRIGHFDAVAARYGSEVQSASCIVLTKLDSLSGQKELSICTGYEIDGKVTEKFPINNALDKAKPVYITMPGWDEDINKVRDFDRLPQTAKDYVLKIEELLGFPIKYVSVGPERESLITR